ncbi:hypothetical protein SAMN04487895_101569 [Paenibacillus sophorae]|uniref:Uncharacterized protein n=1 Tax=Paenibacillus sophorae TaxID=1333845 RepID=A0A1H8GMN3_9BACL|nr:hypothetical protein [Paenibacillus sophorae]QWU14272.1 hypothetical protein KP014_20405 [Paenibacillus sophorae]SEN45045.1 hypothetical protein SAMN04487895_101569 [Paenibacillus sophorae]
MKKTIAEHMYDILIENGRNSVWYGDLDEIHECANRAGMYDKHGDHHPLKINNRVLSALDKSDLFTKGYIKHIGRPARHYTIKHFEAMKK